MAYLGNQDLGQSLNIGGASASPLYGYTSREFDEDIRQPKRGRGRKKRTSKKKVSKKQINDMGQMIAQLIIEKYPEMGEESLKGGSFWNDFKKGFDTVMKPAAKVFKKVAPIVGGPAGAVGAEVVDALGYGAQGGNFWGDFKKGFDTVMKPAGKVFKKVAPIVGGPGGALAAEAVDALGYGSKPKKQKRKQSAKMKRRGEMIKMLMNEEGMTLPEASRYIKNNNLV